MPETDLNQFQLLYNAHPKNSALDPATLSTIDTTTDTDFGLLRETVVSRFTPNLLGDATICKGYVLRANEEPPPANMMNALYQSTPYDRVARCMIVDNYHTELLAFPSSYDETKADRSIIDSYPGFVYSAMEAGDIIRGCFVKVAFWPGSYSKGTILSKYEEDPIILAKQDKSKMATGFGGKQNPLFLYETVVPDPPVDTSVSPTRKNSGYVSSNTGWNSSPKSTYVIPPDYFHPSKHKKRLAKMVSGLDDAVKPRFARAIKKFIVQYYDLGYDLKINFGYRSNDEQDYLWRLQHGGVEQPDGTIKQKTTGAVKSGRSWHNYGCAVDILVWEKGRGAGTARGEKYPHPVHGQGSYDTSAGPGSVYHTKLRAAMLTEGLYNPVDGVQMKKADAGHYQPIEVNPKSPPSSLRSGKVTLASIVRDPGGPVSV